MYDLMDRTSTLPSGTATIKVVTDDEPDDTPYLSGVVVLLILALVAVAILARRSGQ